MSLDKQQHQEQKQPRQQQATTYQQLNDDVLPNELSHVAQEIGISKSQRQDLWRSNYHEASIYIEEGLNNDKFENHPRKRASKLVSANLNSNHELNYQQQQTTPLLATCIKSDTDEKLSVKASNGSLFKKRPNGSGFSLGGGQYTTIETYILVHNRYFYQLDLVASIVLLALALIEPPAVDGYELNPTIHAAVEMFALGIIAIELLLKFRWMGPRRFFSHGRTVTKLIVLIAMNLEAIVIFLRHSIHARYSRALRPIFLIDNHYCHGLRRAVRQIFQSLPPIIDMFTLAMFFMFVFSIFGFYLFATNNYYFRDMPSTVGNLLVLATTASLPDVFMPSYAISRWSAIFFVLFIIIHLFLFTNLTMAAVYEIFTRKEKEKFHKLLLHRRKACQKAFKLLVSRREPNRIKYRQFMGLMRYLNQKCSMFDAYLIFKALDTDKSGSISLEEFYQIYDFINLEWKLIYPECKWYDSEHMDKWPVGCMATCTRSVLLASERLVKHRVFEWIVDLLIATQALLQFIEAAALELPLPNYFIQTNNNTQLVNQTAPLTTQQQVMMSLDDEAASYVKPDKVSTFVFIVLFVMEFCVRLLALGWREYWRKRWNRFDLLVLLVSVSGLISGALGTHPFGWMIVLRVLRLMRLFEFKRRYKDMWQTLTYILLKRFVSMTCVVMILYYFFAIIGMELFGDYDLRNCCKNTSIENQFKYDDQNSNSTGEGAKYYLNDFGDIVASYMTLFSMSSSTYWLTTMDAYAIVSGTNWTRAFFGLYYLGSIIVMNIVIAFILESFLFHIHYRNKMGNNCDDTSLFTVSVTLTSFEVDFLRTNLSSQSDVQQLDRIVRKMSNAQNKQANDFCSHTFSSKNDEELGERMSLLSDTTSKGKSSKQKRRRNVNNNNNNKILSSSSTTTSPSTGKPINDQTNNDDDDTPLDGDTAFGSEQRRPEWYFIYQAEQIRNKFSFTMKMYADEVEHWLAEAQADDQDEMSTMISRNQLRAEHVAMARLARRNLAAVAAALEDNHHHHHHLLDWSRPRSWSTSGSAATAARLASERADHDHDHHHHSHASARHKRLGDNK